MFHSWKLFSFPSILLHSAPGPFTKSINSDDVFAEGSEQHLGKVSQLQKQSKHPVSPWRDTVNSAVVKEQTTHKKESYDVELYEKRYKELERNLKMYQVRAIDVLKPSKKKKIKRSPNVGLEPTTLRLRVSCSTD